MSLSAAFWCSGPVSCFRICLDSAGLEAFSPCCTVYVDVSKGGQSHKALLERKMGSWRIQPGRTLQGRCCQAQQLRQTDHILSRHVEVMQLCCHRGVSPISFLSKPSWTPSTVLFFLLAFLVGYFHNSEL